MIPVHKGVEFENAGLVPEAKDDDPYEWQVIRGTFKKSPAEAPGEWTALSQEIIGVT